MRRWVAAGLMVAMALGVSRAQEGTDGVTAAVEALAGRKLRLGTDEQSAAERFSFTFRAAFPARLAPRDMAVRVARDGARMGALVRANGVAFAYVSNDFFVAMDVTTPGTLLVCEKGQPSFVFAGDGEEKNPGMRFDLTFRPAPAEVRLDAGELLRNAVRRMTVGSIDDVKHTIEFSTAKTKVRATRSEGAFAISGFEIAGPGATLSVEDIALGEHANAELLAANLEAVKKLGMPTRMISPEAAASVSLIPPRDFGLDDSTRHAGEKLMGLFSAGAATRPAQ